MHKTVYLATLTALPAMAWGTDHRPNIVVFLVDDMGLMDTSVPFLTDSNGQPVSYPLNQRYRTPNMAQLAQQGTRFSTFYAQSVSSPSRVSLLTGQNATRHGTTNWIQSESNNRTTYGPPLWNWQGISGSDTLYTQLLQQAGYRTIHVGKAHWGPIGSEGEEPLRLGFDVNIGGSSIGEPGSYRGEDGYGLLRGTRSRAVPHLEEFHNTPTFLTDALTIKALEEVEKAVGLQQPFYLNLCHYAVHNPFQTDPRFAAHYRAEALSPQAMAFATLIEGMDHSLGMLLQRLDELHIAENTLILFLGDNGSDAPLGDASHHASSAPLRGKKGSEFEGGTRVPFIAAWARPNAQNPLQQRFPIASGALCHEIGTIMDLYPTILSVAGIQPAKLPTLDGYNLQPLLAGKPDRKRRNEVLLHFPHEHRGSYFTTYRQGDWKIIYYYHPEQPEAATCALYNLKHDPFEQHNIAHEQPRKLKRMFRAMQARLAQQGALYPVDKDGKPLPPTWKKP